MPHSKHVQGFALVTGKSENVGALAPVPSSPFLIPVEWYRVVELPLATAYTYAPALLLPTPTTHPLLNMGSDTGGKLLSAVWNSPVTTLYERSDGVTVPAIVPMKCLDVGESPPHCPPLAPSYGGPKSKSYTTDPNHRSWPTRPGPGFIFGCNTITMGEALGRGIFGLPMHMKLAATSTITPGSVLFLYNMSDGLLFGIFEAVSEVALNIEPRLYSKNPKAVSSPFPVQVRVRVMLECPPLEDLDPVLVHVLRNRGWGTPGGAKIGPLTHAQAAAIATALAAQCGALDFMAALQSAADEGREFEEPPITLPPETLIEWQKEEEEKRTKEASSSNNNISSNSSNNSSSSMQLQP